MWDGHAIPPSYGTLAGPLDRFRGGGQSSKRTTRGTRLTYSAGPEKLWRSAYPWKDRVRGKKAMQVGLTFTGFSYEKMAHPISRGMEPPRLWHKYEQRATILGGAQALQAAGIPGYGVLDIGDLSKAKAGRGRNDKMLLKLSQSKSLQQGAERIRRAVIKNKLERPAWGYRGLLLIQPAIISATARGATATAIATFVPWVYIGVAQEAALGAWMAKEVVRFKRYIGESQGASAAAVAAGPSEYALQQQQAQAQQPVKPFPVVPVVVGGTALVVILVALSRKKP